MEFPMRNYVQLCASSDRRFSSYIIFYFLRTFSLQNLPPISMQYVRHTAGCTTLHAALSPPSSFEAEVSTDLNTHAQN